MLGLAITLFLAIAFTAPAQAGSHFKVTNNSDSGVQVKVYNGSDAVCSASRETSRVGKGKTKDFHCKGQGKDRCKVELSVPNNNDRLCKDLYNTCGKSARTIADGNVIAVNGTGDGDCAIEK